MPNFTMPERAEDSGRLTAISDGIYSVSLTLLVLDIRVPDDANAHQAWTALISVAPHVFVFVLSFLIVAYTWVWHHLVFGMIKRIDRPILWINMLALLAIALLPFTTAFVARFPGTQAATLAYGGDLLSFSVALTFIFAYAVRAKLLEPELNAQTIRSSLRRCYAQPIANIGAIVLGLIRPQLGIAAFAIIPAVFIATGQRRAVISREPD